MRCTCFYCTYYILYRNKLEKNHTHTHTNKPPTAGVELVDHTSITLASNPKNCICLITAVMSQKQDNTRIMLILSNVLLWRPNTDVQTIYCLYGPMMRVLCPTMILNH